jgi:hypothetical protein
MSAEMYSTNPSLFGGAAIVAAGWMASRPLAPGASTGIAPYVLVGFGYLLYVMALTTTASVGLSGLLRVCAVMGGLASGIAAWLAWRSPYGPLKWTCVAGGVIVLAWGFVSAARIERNERKLADPEKKL